MTTETTIDRTAMSATPAPTDLLARASLEALDRYREASRERSRAERALMAHLSPAATELYRALSDADSEAQGGSTDLHVAELCRHFPGLAPAIRLAWAHVIDERPDRVSRYCTDGESVEV